MASASTLLSKEQLLCPICLDLFDLPVSTPCGHNFCRECIQGYWQSAKLSQCPMCKQRYLKRPELKVNTFISEVASQFKRSLETTDSSEGERSLDQNLSCDVCVGKKSVKAVKSCLDCLASFCETHLEPHHVLGTLKKHRIINPTMNMQERVCKKHEKLLDLHCRTDQEYVCQLCMKRDHKAHHTVPVKEESRDKRAQIRRLHEEVETVIRSRAQVIAKINQTVKVSRGNTERELEESLQIFNKLLHHIHRGQAEVLELISEKQRQVETRAGKVISELQQDIDELRQKSTKLQQLLNSEDDFYLLKCFPALSSPPAAKDRTQSAVECALFVGTVRRAVRRVSSQLEETAKTEVKRLCEKEFHRAQQCSVNVTFDPDTAHPKLVLSENKKQVHHGDVAQKLPNNPERFYPGVSLLAKEGFSSGRFYFEVQVKGKTEWDIGVGLESVNRKGGSVLNPDRGYWTLGMRKDKSYWALSSTPICVPLVEKPQKVGVFVDVEWGQVSFYNADSTAHIYSFTGYSFKEKLFPYFNPRRNHGGINSAPLVILPVHPSA